jgi:ribosomal protein L9
VGVDHFELFDIENDPSEMHNLYGKVEVADIQAELHAQLIKIKKHYKAP